MNAVASPPDISRDLALELHRLLKQIDPARWRPELELRVRQRLESLREALGSLLARIDGHGRFASLHAALQQVGALLDELPTPSLPQRDARKAWDGLRRALQRAYDDLSKVLAAWDVHVPRLRPTNYARNVFHVGWGALAITVLSLWPTQAVLLPIIGALFVWAWSMEIGRRTWPPVNALIMKVLGPVAHPHEWHRVNSATWYTTALLVLASSGALTASIPALAVLAVGDPTAAIVGRRFGRTRLVHGRSLEGSLGFVVAGGGVALLVLRLTHPELGWPGAAAVALAASVAGALAELLSRRIDDNFSIPLCAAAAAAMTLGVLGFPA